MLNQAIHSMKTAALIYLCFFTAMVAAAQAGNRPDSLVLKELNARFNHNFVTGDTLSHSQILHPSFVYISASGEYINRGKYLANWQHGFNGHIYWDYRDERIQIFGTTALVHATNKYIIRQHGKERSGMAIYTDIYIKEDGVWKCVQAQVGAVQPSFYPADKTIVRQYDFRK